MRETRHRWHAVTIVPSSAACFVSQACKRNRYLSADAPRLPLSGCDAGHCDCKYRHFTDRRTAARRWEERGAPAAAPVADNRRGLPDRRPQD